MATQTYHPWLHRFAVLTTVWTLLLIGVGGVVTSKGVGLAVPDWPTTYGYNMFLFPFSKMVGGIFYEHSHRLIGSAVGFLTMILAGWLAWKDRRAWMRALGWIALAAVIVQGVLGGLRVVWLKDEIGIFHACLAQAFLVLIGSIALFTSRWWLNLPAERRVVPGADALRTFAIATTAMIFLQLILGAAMRHEHAGLSIPDFPLSYGSWIPPLDAASVAAINQQRVQWLDLPATTSAQIALQFAHRIIAILIVGCVAACAWKIRRLSAAGVPVVRGFSMLLVGLVVVQAVLGASTVWTNKAADIATAHVVVGSLTLLAASLLNIVLIRVVRSPETAPESAASAGQQGAKLRDLEMAR